MCFFTNLFKKKSHVEQVQKQPAWIIEEKVNVTQDVFVPPPEKPKTETVAVYRLLASQGGDMRWFADYLDKDAAIADFELLIKALTNRAKWWSPNPEASNERFVGLLTGITYADIIKYDYTYEEGKSKFDGTTIRTQGN